MPDSQSASVFADAGWRKRAEPAVAFWRRNFLTAVVVVLTLKVLLVLHHFMARWRRAFAAGTNRHDARFYRRMNEVPTIALIAIVVPRKSAKIPRCSGSAR